MSGHLTSFPLVSVIVPAFNAARFLGQAISSVISQTYNKLEIIIVVDKSSDRTSSVARFIADKDSRILLKILPFKCGAAITRNIGIELASGEFIAFLDADDFWMPDKLERQLPLFFQLDPPLIVFSDYSCVNNGSLSETRVRTPSKKVNYASILRTNCISTSSAVYDARKRKTYFPNLSRRQDWALWMTLLSEKDSFAQSVQSCLVTRRIHSNSLSSNRLLSYWYNYIALRRVGQLSRPRAIVHLFYHFWSAALRRA